MTDERGGRYAREARFILVGDRAVAQSHILDARSLMGYMRDQHALGGPPTQVQYATLKDGTRIKATMSNGQYKAEIISPRLSSRKNRRWPFILRPKTTLIAPPTADMYAAAGVTNTDICIDPCARWCEQEHGLWGNAEWYNGGGRVVSYIRPLADFAGATLVGGGEPRYGPYITATGFDVYKLQTYSSRAFDNNTPINWLPGGRLICGITVHNGLVFVVTFSSYEGSTGNFRVDYGSATAYGGVAGTSDTYVMDGRDFCVKFNQSGDEGAIIVQSDGAAASYLKVTLAGTTASFSVVACPLAAPITNNVVTTDVHYDPALTYDYWGQVVPGTYTGLNHQVWTNSYTTEKLAAVDYKDDVLQLLVLQQEDRLEKNYREDSTVVVTEINTAYGTRGFNSTLSVVGATYTTSTTLRYKLNDALVAEWSTRLPVVTSISQSTYGEKFLGFSATMLSGSRSSTSIQPTTQTGPIPRWFDLRAGVYVHEVFSDSYQTIATQTNDYNAVGDPINTVNSSTTSGSQVRAVSVQVYPAAATELFSLGAQAVDGSQPLQESTIYVKGKALETDGVFSIRYSWGATSEDRLIALCGGVPKDITADLPQQFAMVGIASNNHCTMCSS